MARHPCSSVQRHRNEYNFPSTNHPVFTVNQFLLSPIQNFRPELRYRVIDHEYSFPLLRIRSLLTLNNLYPREKDRDLNTCQNSGHKHGRKREVMCLASGFIFPYINQRNILFPLETQTVFHKLNPGKLLGYCRELINYPNRGRKWPL